MPKTYKPLLAGDVAYRLFMSDKTKPLEDFLNYWREKREVGTPLFVLSVIRVFDDMITKCGDGRYEGKIRTR